MNSGGTAMFDQDEKEWNLLAKSIFATSGRQLYIQYWTFLLTKHHSDNYNVSFSWAFKCPPKAILIWSIKASLSFPYLRFLFCVNLEMDPGVEFSTKRRRHTVHLWATKRNTDEITISFGWKEQVNNEQILILANYSVKTSLLKFGKHISRRG